MRTSLNIDLARKLEGDVCKGNKELKQVWEEIDPQANLKTLELENALAVFGGPECPINEAIGLGMYGPVDEATIEVVEDFYYENNHDTEIRVCPLAHESLVELTKKRGYVLDEFSYRWILDLESWESTREASDLRVRFAESSEEDLWAQVVSSGFSNSDNVLESDNLTLERAFFRMESSLPVVAVDNQVAAGGILALDDEIASLFATSTLPSYRRRGLQTALLDWRLRYAKDNGARIATIETDPGSESQRNVERMGFRLAYVTAQLVKPFTNRTENK